MKVDFASVNYPAVVVAAAATFLIGGAWYTALFGKLWQRLNGYSDEKMREMQAKRPPPVFFGTLLACYLVVALIVALLVVALDVRGAGGGALLGLLLWIGPAAAIGMTGQIASDKPMGVFCIDASYQLIYLVLIGAILGAWR